MINIDVINDELRSAVVERRRIKIGVKIRSVTGLILWGFGFLFVSIINFSIFLGALALPILHKNAEIFQKMLTFMIGLAVGSLSGSAIYHLIPQGLDLPQEQINFYLWKCLTVTLGIYMFFITERVLKMVTAKKKTKKLKNKQLASITKPILTINVNEIKDDILQTTKILHNFEKKSTLATVIEQDDGELNENPETNLSSDQYQNNYGTENINNRLLKTCSHEHYLNLIPPDQRTVSTVAYMILLGDGLHNFVDGLSIGSAFSNNLSSGINISFAVLCEEIPHELGDFAILLSSGMSVRQALLCNFLSSCTCYFGLIAGILLGNITESVFFIFSLAAGMFLYISLVDMLPELINTVDKVSKSNQCKGLKILFIQNTGYLIGTSIMFLMALFTKDIQF